MAIPSPVLGTDSFLAWRTATNDIIGELSTIPLDNVSAVTPPGLTDDAAAGYSISSNWIDTLTDSIYICVDATNGAAAWTLIGTASGQSIDTASDVIVSAVASGELLRWDGTNWINNTLAEAGIAPASHQHTVSSLSDTTIASVTFGEVLKWDGTSWINNTLAEAGLSASNHNHQLGSLSDLTITSVGTNEIISYNGSAWINKTLGEAGIEPANANITKKNVAENITSIWAFNGGTSGINAPFTTDSTYVVTNLNADLLDGQQGAWYSPATHNHTIESLTNTVITTNSTGEILKWDGVNWINNTLAEAGIEPANSNITKKNVAESISSIWAFNGGLSGSTAPFTVDSNTLVTNLNADLLDGLSWTNGTASKATQLETTRAFDIAGDCTTAAVNFNGSGNVTLVPTVNVATALRTSRTITLNGGVSGSATYNGTANSTITCTVANDSHSHSDYVPNTKGGVMDVGRYFDMHGASSTSDFDVRIDCGGGSATSGAGVLSITANGGLVCSGNVTAYSDSRIKNNIESIPNALDKVSQISGYTFDRTDADVPRQSGVIAQEVQAVLPEVVLEDEEGYLSVAYGNMIGLLIEAIKELKAEVDELKGTK